MAATLVLKIRADNTATVSLDGLEKQFKKMNKTMDKTAKKSLTVTRTMKAILGVSVIRKTFQEVTQSLSYFNREILTYEDRMKELQGVTGATPEIMNTLNKSIIGQTNNVEHLATAASQATLELGKMGFKTEEITKVIPGILDFATASMIEPGKAAESTMQTMKSFGMSISDVSHIMDVMQGAIAGTAIGFEDYNESMKFAAPLANSVGVTFEETSALVGILGNVGLKGSLAGTALKNMFTNMIKPGEKITDMLKRYEGEGKNFIDVLMLMKDEGMGVNEFFKVFNLRALAPALALSNTGDQVKKLTEELTNNSGVVKEQSDVMRGSLIKQLQIMRNNLINVGNEFIMAVGSGDKFKVAAEEIKEALVNLQVFIVTNKEKINEMVQTFFDFIKLVSKGIIEITKFTYVFREELIAGLKIFIALKVSSALTGILTGLYGMATGAYTAAGGMKALNASLGIVLAAVVAVNGALSIYEHHVKNIQKQSARASDFSVEGYNRQIKAVREFIKVAEEAQKTKYKLSRENWFGILSKENVVAGKGEDIAEKAGLPPEYFKFKDLDSLKKSLDFMVSERDKLINADKLLRDGFNPNIKAVEDNTKAIKSYMDSQKDLLKNEEKKTNGVSTKEKAYAGRFGMDSTVLMSQVTQVGDEFVNILKSQMIASRVGSPLEGSRLTPESMISPFTDSEFTSSLTAFKLSLDKASEGAKAFRLEVENPFDKPDIGKLMQGVQNAPIYSQGIDPKGNLFGSETALTGSAPVSALTRPEDVLNMERFNELLREARVELDMISQTPLVEFKPEKVIDLAEIKAVAENFVGIFSDAISLIGQYWDQNHQKVMDNLNKEETTLASKKEKELKNAGENKQAQYEIEAKYRKKEETIQKKKDAAEKDNARRKKRLAITQALINTALAISSTLAWTVGGPITKGIAAAVIGAMGAAEVAMISSQNFRTGGMIRGRNGGMIFGSGNGTSDSVPINASRGEYMINEPTVRDLGGATGVQQLIDSALLGSSTSNTSTNVYINTNIGTEEFTRKIYKQVGAERQRWYQSY